MKRYEIQEVFNMLGEENLKVQRVKHGTRASIEVDGYLVKQQSLRYATFYQKGTTCVCCGKQGTHFKLDVERGVDPESTNRRHFNLYAEDGTLMTKDHILPKSLGGEDCVDNLQTMCKDCNELKRSTPQEDLELEVVIATEIQSGKETYYRSIEDAAYKLCMVIRGIGIDKKNKKIKQACVRKAVQATIDLMNAINNKTVLCNRLWTVEKRVVSGKSLEEIMLEGATTDETTEAVLSCKE